MDRRRFLLGSACYAFVVPLVAEGQSADRIRKITVIYGSPREMVPHLEQAFEKSLEAKGHDLGRKLLVEHLGTDGSPDHARAVAAGAVAAKPDVIVAWSTVCAVAVKRATSTIPVVFLTVGVPVEIGLVASLARPGGNMTGVTFEATDAAYAKRLQLLKEVAPRVSRIALLYAIGDQNVRHAIDSVERAAPTLGLRVQNIGVRAPNELGPAFSKMKAEGTQGLLVVAGALTWNNRKSIAELALVNRLPSAHGFRETVVVGGLLSLGPDLTEMARQGAGYVNKILNGATPANLPVEQPAKYELHINLTTAKALGLTIPQSLLVRADQVIE